MSSIVAVNSVAIARAFAHQGWGLLSMLDDNEHQGLESFEATAVGTLEDGTPVYSGEWKVPRQDDPRHFVIVETSQGKTLCIGGRQRSGKRWRRSGGQGLYQQRSEIQENSFKRMIDHGALNTNYGRKKIMGTDRHQQREKEQLDKALGAAHKRVGKKSRGG